MPLAKGFRVVFAWFEHLQIPKMAFKSSPAKFPEGPPSRKRSSPLTAPNHGRKQIRPPQHLVELFRNRLLFFRWELRLVALTAGGKASRRSPIENKLFHWNLLFYNSDSGCQLWCGMIVAALGTLGRSVFHPGRKSISIRSPHLPQATSHVPRSRCDGPAITGRWLLENYRGRLGLAANPAATWTCSRVIGN